MKKVLIVYFSRTGENYVNGQLLHLEEGNTAVVAKKIQKLLDADLFEVRTKKAYPDGYYEATEVAKQELESNFRPELVEQLTDFANYDTIILGYPIWWETFPTALMTFLEAVDCKGKVILPFCTHEGSGLGHSEQDLKEKFCVGAEVRPGLAIYGHAVSQSDGAVRSWLKKNQLL